MQHLKDQLEALQAGLEDLKSANEEATNAAKSQEVRDINLNEKQRILTWNKVSLHNQISSLAQENQSLTHRLEKSRAPIISEEATSSGRANSTQSSAPTTALKSIKAIKQRDAGHAGQVHLKSRGQSKVFPTNQSLRTLNISNYDWIEMAEARRLWVR